MAVMWWDVSIMDIASKAYGGMHCLRSHRSAHPMAEDRLRQKNDVSMFDTNGYRLHKPAGQSKSDHVVIASCLPIQNCMHFLST